jgi:four helix bundle protein
MKKKVTRFEDLIAWQKGRALVGTIYRVSSERPFYRDFALRDQIRDAAISVPSNISEGFERNRLPQFCQFLTYAKASCAEVRTQLYLAFDVGYLDEPKLAALLEQAEEVGRVIGGLLAKLELRLLGTRHSALGTPPPCS